MNGLFIPWPQHLSLLPLHIPTSPGNSSRGRDAKGGMEWGRKRKEDGKAKIPFSCATQGSPTHVNFCSYVHRCLCTVHK